MLLLIVQRQEAENGEEASQIRPMKEGGEIVTGRTRFTNSQPGQSPRVAVSEWVENCYTFVFRYATNMKLRFII